MVYIRNNYQVPGIDNTSLYLKNATGIPMTLCSFSPEEPRRSEIFVYRKSIGRVEVYSYRIDRAIRDIQTDLTSPCQPDVWAHVERRTLLLHSTLPLTRHL